MRKIKLEKKDEILTILSAGPVYINSEIHIFANRVCTPNRVFVIIKQTVLPVTYTSTSSVVDGY